MKKFFRLALYTIGGGLLLASSCEREITDHGHGAAYGHLYVLNQTSRTIYVYNDSSMIRVDSFGSAIPEPHWLEYDPDGSTYYVVARNNPGYIAKFDAVTNSLIDTVRTSGTIFPTSLAITSDGQTGYLCDFNAPITTPGHIHKYNLATMSFVDSSFSNGGASHDLMFNSTGSVLVACSRGTDDVTLVYFPGDSVFIVPLDPNDVRPVPPVHGPYGVHIAHNDTLAYITCLCSGQIKIFNLKSRAVVDSIVLPVSADCLSSSPVGAALSAISHDDSKIYVTTQFGNNLIVVNTANKNVLAQIPFDIPRSFGVKLNGDGSRVYVACANLQGQPGRVYVIDAINLVKVDSIDVGLNSYGLYWHSH
jgi:DNA-binding beta-propeller fold protein YncE